MALNKTQKQEILDDLKDKIAKQKAMILVGITGLKVKDVSGLRKQLKAADGNLKVIKKTLIEKAFKENKLDFDKNKYKEEMAVAFGFKDEIVPAKAVYQAGLANEKLKILGGFIDNKFNEAESIIALAKLPSREELLAKLVGSLSAPVSNFVYALNYNIKGLVHILSLIKK
jgi:large subunit ribosomal protein L10